MRMLCSVLLIVVVVVIEGKLNVQSSDGALNGSFTIVNVHLHQLDLWNYTIFFNGKIEINDTAEKVYYNVSNFIFFDVADTDYLFNGYYSMVVEAQKLGARYAVIREKIDPPGRRYIFPRYREGIEIPVVAIEAGLSEDFYIALSENVGQQVQVIAVPDENSWFAFKSTLLVFNILLVLLSGIPPSIAIYKMKLFIYAGKCELSISIICLTLNLIGDIMRMGGVIIDPYTLIIMDQYALSTMLLVYPFFFLISSGLLIIFYWAEILNDKSTNVSNFLSRFRIPFYSTIILLLIVNIAFAVILIAVPGFDLGVVIFLADFLIILFTGIFYIAIGTRVYKKITTLNRASKVTRLILAAGVWIIILTVILFIFVILSLTIEWQYRYLDLTIYNLMWISRFGISSIFSSIFSPPKKKTFGSKSKESKLQSQAISRAPKD